jgi:hypothetical protein
MHHAEVPGVCYTALDLISVFDAALLWHDRDPHQTLPGYGLYGWIVLLIRDREICDLAYTLLSEIERGSMEAASSAWLADIPSSWKSRLGEPPGGRDPRRTMITIASLVKFAAKRSQKPKFLAQLMADPMTHTGAAGRPSSMNLVEQEMERRAAEGSLAPTIADEARQLSERMKLIYPSLPTPKPKTIANSLREKYRSLRRSKPSPKL